MNTTKPEFTQQAQLGEIVADMARRIDTQGLSTVLDMFRNQGMPEHAIHAVLIENSIVAPDAVVMSGALAHNIACDLLAAERAGFPDGMSDTQVYQAMSVQRRGYEAV